MKIEKIHIDKKLTAKVLLLVIPACIVAAYMLWHINQYYTVLNNEWIKHSAFLALGLITSSIFYNYRFRFISTLIPLLLIFITAAKLIQLIFTGEFSAFYASTNFFIFSFLFNVGWLIGWGFIR